MKRRIVGAIFCLTQIIYPLQIVWGRDSAPVRPQPSNYIRPQVACPDRLETLVPPLLRDLPSYANRVSQRAYLTEYRSIDNPGYVLLAARPEFEPLPLGSNEYKSDATDPGNEVSQVFFTTLERQYIDNRAVTLQHYHWLFLTQTSRGWRLVLMRSAIGDVPANEPPTPPRDSSEGVVAQAVRLWLQDCEAQSVQP